MKGCENLSQEDIRLLKIIHEVKNLDITSSGISLDTKMCDLELESLEYMKILIMIEREFDIKFDNKLFANEVKFVNIRDFLTYILGNHGGKDGNH